MIDESVSIRDRLTDMWILALRSDFNSIVKIYEIKYINKMNNSDIINICTKEHNNNNKVRKLNT